jgi:hypothetical protein
LESAATTAVTPEQQPGVDADAAAAAVAAAEAAETVLLPVSLAGRVARLQAAQQALREKVMQVSDGRDHVVFYVGFARLSCTHTGTVQQQQQQQKQLQLQQQQHTSVDCPWFISGHPRPTPTAGWTE